MGQTIHHSRPNPPTNFDMQFLSYDPTNRNLPRVRPLQIQHLPLYTALDSYLSQTAGSVHLVSKLNQTRVFLSPPLLPPFDS